MNRQIGIKRLYSLGDFKNITFDDVMTEVPQEFALDTVFVSQVKFLQLISIEIAFRRYVKIMEDFPLAGGEEMVKALEELRQDTVDSIQEILNGDTEA